LSVKKGSFSMKNTPKLTGITAFLAVIALTMTALSVTGCPTGDDIDGIYGINNGGNVYLREELVFSGQQVYQKSGSQQYTEDITLNDNNGGKVEIKGGKFNYTIGTPGNLEAPSKVFYNYNNIFATVSVSDPTARVFLLKFENDLNKGNSSNVTVERVVYVYADKDVTLSGTGETKTYTEDDPNNFYGIPYIEKTNGYWLALKKGWNAL